MKNRLWVGAALILSSALSVGLYLVRVAQSNSLTFFFLNWNLFLAWIPLLAVAMALWLQGDASRPRLRVAPWLAVWLLFFPNAPYIMTDLMHVAQRDGAPLWFDALLIGTYAWNGLIVGFVSLWIVQAMVARWGGAVAGWVAAAAAIWLGAFGVYLGRFERWNSWDIVTQPMGVTSALLHAAISP